MNADCYFKIGHTHERCEDYALTGNVDDVFYAIISDGCSASDFVDFGARLLTFAAKFAIKAGQANASYTELGKRIISRADTAALTLNVQKQALDATLLLATWTPARLRICMWGDGVVVLRNGPVERVIHVEYTSGAPNYLSYYLEAASTARYRETMNDPVIIKTRSIDAEGRPACTELETGIDHNIDFDFEADRWSQVSLLSDGVNTFKNPGGTVFPYKEIVPEFTVYKNTSGVFVNRRMKFFEKKCAAEQIVHDDDISVASIVK